MLRLILVFAVLLFLVLLILLILVLLVLALLILLVLLILLIFVVHNSPPKNEVYMNRENAMKKRLCSLLLRQ